MKKLIFSLLIVFLFPISSQAFDLKDNNLYSLNHTEKWDKWDKGLLISYSAMMTIDCLQTRDLLDKHQKELFGLEKYFNKNTVPIIFIGCTYLSYKIADHLKSKPRKIFLTTLNIIDFNLVNNNKQIGLKLKF